MTRVLNPKREVDYVFGIEIPCIEERGRSIDLDKSVLELQKKTEGVNGVFVSRCLNDLISAMKHANDTAFYCYRAIESLRHHCAALNGLSAASRLKQWEKFRQVSGTPEKDIRFIKEAADPLRHGQVSNITSSQRAELFKLTWDVVGAYLEAI